MKIYRPIKTDSISQRFGESKACVKINPTTQKPYRPFIVRSKKASEFCGIGWRDFYKAIGMDSHNGRDNAVWNGEPLYFPAEEDCKWYARNDSDPDDGIGLDVYSDRPIYIKDIPFRGKLDLIQDELDKHDGKVFVKIRFWHLKESLMKNGEEVKLGQMIARCDNTGASSGHHLHWSWKVVKQAGKAGFTLDKDNGYYGAEPFGSMYENRFVLDVLSEKLKVKVVEHQLTIIDLLKKIILDLRIRIKKLST